MINGHGFTDSQLSTAYELLTYISENKNNILKGIKITSIQAFKNKYGELFISYIFHGTRNGEPHTTIKYFEINRDGKKTDLEDVYDNSGDISRDLANYEEIIIA
jgi:hypothetical protein